MIAYLELHVDVSLKVQFSSLYFLTTIVNHNRKIKNATKFIASTGFGYLYSACNKQQLLLV